jgi:hypothetical protein
MPSLISQTEKDNLTGIFGDIFDTFCRQVIIYKEPLKTRISAYNPDNFVFGFGENQGEDGFTYTDVTGIFPATIRYKSQDVDKNSDSNTEISQGEVSIKVKRDCRDFINSGKTEKIVLDARTFVLDGDEETRSFLDSEFWVFKLKATK